MTKKFASFTLLCFALAACTPTVKLQGGPKHESVELQAATYQDDLRPLIESSPAAIERYNSVRARESLGMTLLYTGFGFLAVCIAGNAISPSTEGSTALYVGLGACGASILFDVGALIVLPGQSGWGEVLKTYNADHPDAAWYSDDLGVPK